MFATPIAYLMDEASVITDDVAVAGEVILALAKEALVAAETSLTAL